MAAQDQTKDQTLKSFSGTLVLVGAGKMGGALLEGWLARGLNPKSVVIVEPHVGKDIAALAKRGARINPKKNPGEATAIIIAVKPQMAEEALPFLAPMIGKNTLLLSIMAGRTLRSLAQILGPSPSIVRAMPNTPAAIGRGVTVAVANARATPRHRKLATDLLAAAGAVEWVNDETLMDAVTAVSGSGPAYVFLLAEALAQAGVAAGLPDKLAMTLARETIAGSGELLHRSGIEPETLRQNVTSPGGTTAAALKVLMGPGGIPALLGKAIAAAAKRSRELAG